MTVRVGLNGFGRTGRALVRALVDRDLPIDLVAINDLASADELARLLARDSVHGPFPGVECGGDKLVIRGREILILHEPDPKGLPWTELGIQVAVEASGRFTSAQKASAHLEAGAERVVVSAPSKGADATFVIGVNDHLFDPDRHRIVSNASCTTNCLVPMVSVLDGAFGIESGLMTTTHAYTGDQRLVDGLHSDPRRARAAALNIVPTSTGAARATALVIEAMEGRLDGAASSGPGGRRVDHRSRRAAPGRGDRGDGQRGLLAGRQGSRGRLGVLRRAPGIHGHRGPHGVVRLRLGYDHGVRAPGQGVRLVRQRGRLREPVGRAGRQGRVRPSLLTVLRSGGGPPPNEPKGAPTLHGGRRGAL